MKDEQKKLLLVARDDYAEKGASGCHFTKDAKETADAIEAALKEVEAIERVRGWWTRNEDIAYAPETNSPDYVRMLCADEIFKLLPPETPNEPNEAA